MSGEDRGETGPSVRPLGAWVVGVGLHPIALAAYELMHLGRSNALGVLARIGVAILAVLEILDLSLGPLPWSVTLVTQAIVTAAWVRVTYRRVDTQKMPGIHYPGLGLALAVYAPIAFLQWTH